MTRNFPYRSATCSLLALLLLGVLTVFTPATPADAANRCSQSSQVKQVARYARKARVPAPKLVFESSGSGAFFSPGTRTITLRTRCVEDSVLAHEFGHYVVDLAAQESWAGHLGIAKRFTAYPNWVKAHGDTDGLERAAHCVGRLFYAGSYTKCPTSAARKAASAVLTDARRYLPA